MSPRAKKAKHRAATSVRLKKTSVAEAAAQHARPMPILKRKLAG